MTTPAQGIFNNLKLLWLLVTGGAFVSFAGGALTLFYFWGIGGIPIWQTASLGVMANVVLPTAIFIAVAVMMVWLVPSTISVLLADESTFMVTLRHLFASNGGENSVTSPDVTEPLVASKNSARLTHNQDISILRIGGFSLCTVGLGGIVIILCAIAINYHESVFSYRLMMSGFALLGLAVQVVFLRKMWRKSYGGIQGTVDKERRKHEMAWYALGFSSSIVSVTPLFTLLLLFLRSDLLLKSESLGVFACGAAIISVGIVVAYAASLWSLVEQRHRKQKRWAIALMVNAVTLVLIVISLGLSSRMLESVMVLASVRVENAVIILEQEGCELLESMETKGWGFAAQGRKICVLPNVTIQSTLEPAIQIACWRGTISHEKAKRAKNVETARSAAYIVDVTGQNGAFTMPVKYVKSIWKTGGIAASGNEELCASQLKYKPHEKPAAPAPSASSSSTLGR